MSKQKDKSKQQKNDFSSRSEISWDVIETYIDFFLSLLTQIAESMLVNPMESEQEIIQKDPSIFNRYTFFSPSAQQLNERPISVSANLNFFEEENFRSRLI